MNSPIASEAEVLDQIVDARLDDEEARPLLDQLHQEYMSRYGEFLSPDHFDVEAERYPGSLFAPPNGRLLLILRDGRAIAGGAYTRLDEQTAELKRIWTNSDHRRQGLARRVVQALEQAVELEGYERIFLTTGFRQPEAVALYLSLDYRPLFDVERNWDEIYRLPFEKSVQLAGAAT